MKSLNEYIGDLVIGGYALIQYADPRYTKDLDFGSGCHLKPVRVSDGDKMDEKI